MAHAAVYVELDTEPARAWVRDSLSQGASLSERVLERLSPSDGVLGVFVPRDLDRGRLTNLGVGGVTARTPPLESLRDYVLGLVGPAGGSLIVEDDVRRRGDPAVLKQQFATGFLGDRVIRWVEVSDEGKTGLSALIRSGAMGYPLNAFVTRLRPHELALANGKELGDAAINATVDALVAVVVAVYDAESFLIWEPAPRRRRLS